MLSLGMNVWHKSISMICHISCVLKVPECLPSQDIKKINKTPIPLAKNYKAFMVTVIPIRYMNFGAYLKLI